MAKKAKSDGVTTKTNAKRKQPTKKGGADDFELISSEPALRGLLSAPLNATDGNALPWPVR